MRRMERRERRLNGAGHELGSSTSWEEGLWRDCEKLLRWRRSAGEGMEGSGDDSKMKTKMELSWTQSFHHKESGKEASQESDD